MPNWYRSTNPDLEVKELRNRLADIEQLLGRTKFSTRDAFKDCILIWDTVTKAFRPAASSISIQEIVVASTDHGDLGGLGDDDHPQYAQIAGTETLTGAWTFDRGAGAPFVCVAGATVVADLDADKVDGHHLDQDVLIASEPTFAKLDVPEIEHLGDLHLDARDTGGNSTVYIENTAPGLHASLDVERNVTVGHNIACTGQIQSAGMTNPGADPDKFVTANAAGWLQYRTGDEILADLEIDLALKTFAPTEAELDQLENIGAVTISATQWGYLGGFDQDLQIADGVQFNTLHLTGNLTTDALIDGVDVADLKTDVDGFPDELKNLSGAEIGELCHIDLNAISSTQWGYVSGMDQAVSQASAVAFGGLTINGTSALNGNVTTHHLYPLATDTYDLGSSTLLWRKGWLSELESILFVENTVQLVGGWFWVPHGSGTLQMAAPSGNNYIAFGQAMTPGDFVLLRSSLQVEYVEVGALWVGTTYYVTRDLDGSGANDWVKGQAYAIMGASGDGRIELDAQTRGPTIMMLEQGATYNAQTERVRIGDLNGWGPYGAQTFGIGMGDYAGDQCMYYDPAEGLVVKGTLTAALGEIGGWTIGASTLTGGNVTLSSAGVITVGAANNVVILDATDATYRLWVGHATAGSAPFRVSQAGVLTATSGTVGGWTMAATTLTGTNVTLTNTGIIQVGTGNDLAILSAVDATYRFWIGNATAGSAPFRVTKAGALVATAATITGAITATSGDIGTLGVSGTLTLGAAGKMTWTGGKLTVDGIDFVEGTSNTNFIRWRLVNTEGSVCGRISSDWGGGGTDPVALWLTSTIGAGQSPYYAITVMKAEDITPGYDVRWQIDTWGGGRARFLTGGSTERFTLSTTKAEIKVACEITGDLRISAGLVIGTLANNPNTGELRVAKGIGVGATNFAPAQGCVTMSGGLWVGSNAATPANGCLYLEGSIRKSTAIGCRAYRSTTQTISTSPTSLSWNTQVHDSYSMFAPTSQYMYAQLAGYYIAGGCWWLNSNATCAHRMQLSVRKGGSKVYGANEVTTISGSKLGCSVVSGMFYMSVGEYIELVAYQNSGSNLLAQAATVNSQEKNSGWLMRVA